MSHWIALKVKPQKEFTVQRNLMRMRIKAYSPIERRLARIGGSRYMQTKRYPLLTGYCFMRVSGPIDWIKVRQVDGIAGFLGDASGNPKPFQQSEIDYLRQIAKSPTGGVQRSHKGYRVGDVVKTTNGILGKVESIKGAVAQLKTTMFNSTRVVPISVDALEAA